MELVFDGKTLTINNKGGDAFAQVEAPGIVDQVIDQRRDNHGVTAPGADLLLSNPFDVLMADVIDAIQVGVGVIDGVECDHLAFRNEDTDWQIWIEAGTRPIPRKYVITNKGVTGAPEYTLRIKDWRTEVPADAFAFKTAEGAKKGAITDLTDIDEVPQGTAAAGGKK